MHKFERMISHVIRAVRGARWLIVALVLSLAAVSPASAAPKKKAEEVAATKSYVVPYMVVLALVGLGLMSVCRPSKRKDKPDERKEEED